MEQMLDNAENEIVESGKDSNFEAQASKMGWVPKEKFRGDPERWVDAEAFVKRGEEVLPIVKAELRKTREELEEVKKAAGDWQRMQEDAFARKEAEWKARLAEVTQAKKDAVAQGDGEKFAEAEQAERELRDSKPEAPKKEAPKLDPEFKSWLDENDWYGQDKDRTKKANAIGAALAIESEGQLRGRAFYDAVKERLEAQENAQSGTARTGAQRGGKVAVVAKGARTYENLKSEFREACDKQFGFFGGKTTPEKWRESWLSKATDDMFRS